MEWKDEGRCWWLDVTAMYQFKECKLKIPPIIDFIISDEFNNVVGKNYSLFLILLMVTEELVEVSSSEVLGLQHYKTWGWVFLK